MKRNVILVTFWIHNEETSCLRVFWVNIYLYFLNVLDFILAVMFLKQLSDDLFILRINRLAILSLKNNQFYFVFKSPYIAKGFVSKFDWPIELIIVFDTAFNFVSSIQSCIEFLLQTNKNVILVSFDKLISFFFLHKIKMKIVSHDI